LLGSWLAGWGELAGGTEFHRGWVACCGCVSMQGSTYHCSASLLLSHRVFDGACRRTISSHFSMAGAAVQHGEHAHPAATMCAVTSLLAPLFPCAMSIAGAAVQHGEHAHPAAAAGGRLARVGRRVQHHRHGAEPQHEGGWSFCTAHLLFTLLNFGCNITATELNRNMKVGGGCNSAPCQLLHPDQCFSAAGILAAASVHLQGANCRCPNCKWHIAKCPRWPSPRRSCTASCLSSNLNSTPFI